MESGDDANSDSIHDDKYNTYGLYKIERFCKK